MAELFEIHITGDESIHEMTAAIFPAIKTIRVELLRPNLSVIRTEHMTSFVKKFESFDICLLEIKNLETIFNAVRSKIECPPYAHYIDQALYVESHFKAEPEDAHLFPISRNIRSGKLMCTKREYNRSKFKEFLTDTKPGVELELCLYDTNVNEDQDWLELWRKQ